MKPVPPSLPMPPTPPPSTTPPATPPRIGLPGQGRHRRVRHRTGTTAPHIQWHQSSTGQPCCAVRPYSRPLQHSTTGRAWGGRRRRSWLPPPLQWGRGQGRGRRSHEKKRHRNAAPHPASSLRCGDSPGGGAGVSLKMTDDKQTANKCRLTRGFQCHASTNSPQKTQPAVGMGERRWQDSFQHKKGRDGDTIIPRLRMMLMTLMTIAAARGGQWKTYY
jgi:hypothetical protein